MNNNGLLYFPKGAVAPVPFVPQAAIVFATAGSFNWYCPDGVTRIKLRAWGGGGGGSTGGGGGGGGYGEWILSVVPGRRYAGVVGAGGASNTVGGDTIFDGVVRATGGGAGGVAGGAGGTSAAPVNLTGQPGGATDGGDAAMGGFGGFSGTVGTAPGGGGAKTSQVGADGRIIIEF